MINDKGVECLAQLLIMIFQNKFYKVQKLIKQIKSKLEQELAPLIRMFYWSKHANYCFD